MTLTDTTLRALEEAEEFMGEDAHGLGLPYERLRKLTMGEGLGSVDELREELDGYLNVLMGRKPPPIDNGVLTLQEYANAVYSRAAELTMLILRGESDNKLAKGSRIYRFRTGELRTFMELAAKASDLGSRRLTQAQTAYTLRHG